MKSGVLTTLADAAKFWREMMRREALNMRRWHNRHNTFFLATRRSACRYRDLALQCEKEARLEAAQFAELTQPHKEAA